MDSCKSLLCDQKMKRIWSWATEKAIFIILAHNPGIVNEETSKPGIYKVIIKNRIEVT